MPRGAAVREPCPVPPTYFSTQMYQACMSRARDIRYGRQQARSLEERLWAKNLTFVEAYSGGISALTRHIRRSRQ